MRPTVDDDDADRFVTAREACALMGVHRTTLWRWIEAGLPYEREDTYPFRYFYRVSELRRMKLQRTAARIAVPMRDESEYDYE